MKLQIHLTVILSLGVITNQHCFNGYKIFPKDKEWISTVSVRNKCILDKSGKFNIAVVGCITANGSTVVPSVDKKGRFVCTDNENPEYELMLRRQSAAEPSRRRRSGGVGCTDSKGRHHELGTYWMYKSFNQTCLPNGQVDTIGCIIPEGRTLPVNETLITEKKKYRCRKCDDNSVELETFDGCVDTEGNFHLYGDTWTENQKTMKQCLPGGSITNANCTCVPVEASSGLNN